MSGNGAMAVLAQAEGREPGRFAAWRRAAFGETGQALVEMSISLCMMMAFVFLLMELCLLFYSYSMISELAREGSRYAMVRGMSCVTSGQASCTASASAINAYVAGVGYPNLAGGAMTVSTTYPDGTAAAGSRVKVGIQYVFPVKMPFLPSNPITLNTSSTMYIVQ